MNESEKLTATVKVDLPEDTKKLLKELIKLLKQNKNN